jgi:uncharacterized membrane protein
MASRPDRSFTADFKRFFVRGLGILLPSVLTLWLLVAAYRFVDTNVGEPINQAIRFVVLQTIPRVVDLDDPHADLPEWFVVTPGLIEQERRLRREQNQPQLSDERLRTLLRSRSFKYWWDEHWYLRIVGMLVAIILIYLAGVMLGGYIGRRIYLEIEDFFTRLPVVKQVYPSVKRVVEFLFGEQSVRFNRVVLVEYPRRGLWSLGLVTGPAMRAIQQGDPSEYLSVFIPSSPTPVTGYTITVRRDETIDLNISIDDALRFTVSGGVVLPTSQQLARQPSMLDDDATWNEGVAMWTEEKEDANDAKSEGKGDDASGKSET